jgi:hypothetical protein
LTNRIIQGGTKQKKRISKSQKKKKEKNPKEKCGWPGKPGGKIAGEPGQIGQETARKRR